MARASAARRVAAKALGEVRRRDAHARDLLRESRDMATLEPRERALATRLVLGVTAAQGLLDERIEARLMGRARLEPRVRDALRLCAFELLFLQTPTGVAVSQGVELVREVRPRAAGLANAVLRRIGAEDVPVRSAALERVRANVRAGSGGAVRSSRAQGSGAGVGNLDAARDPVLGEAVGSLDSQDFVGDPDVQDLAWVSGYPAWLLERMGESAAQVALSACDPAPVYVAANLALHGEDKTLRLLEDAGLAPSACDVAGSFVLERPAALAASGLVEGADVVVADLSAQRVTSELGVRAGMRVLEVGQGRGTKSLLMESAALRTGGTARIVGVDFSAFKVRVADKRMRRSGLSQAVTCLEFDARKLAEPNLPEELCSEFDLVFVDAPCSGTGTLRRHPEICWSLRPADVQSLARLQLQILQAAAVRVRAGGLLRYATCSVLRDEDQDVVRGFLQSAVGRDFVQEKEPLQTWPRPDGPDGHFLAFLRRVPQGE